jgi:2-polyprenyl-3-methyl-5-hydroxy-6-metoxy-1,4-benzoquinol methylase
LWTNHASSFDFYINEFLKENPPDYRHLEIGPGHGLLLYYASIDPRCGSLAAWDISPVSIRKAADCLRTLGVEREVEFEVRDVTSNCEEDGQFESIVFSEVLEHLEHPEVALGNIREILCENGRLFLNVPINAPAIDHIFLLRSPEEATEFVQSCGFAIERVRLSPTSGYTEERARRRNTSISVALLCRRQ